MWITDQVAWQ